MLIEALKIKELEIVKMLREKYKPILDRESKFNKVM